MNAEVFIKQFRELCDRSPHIFSMSRDNENSLFTDEIAYSKNAYYLFTGGWIQDCYYGEFFVKCQDCVDCLKIEQSTLCYECLECIQCYNSNYLLQCSSVQDSEYGINLKNCSSCFLSGNLQHASYVFKNKKYSKTEYDELLRSYKREKSSKQLYGEWRELCARMPRINVSMTQCENCVGNNLSFSKNVFCGFDLVNAEDVLYSEEGGFVKDSCDTLLTTGQLNYECFRVTKNSYNCNFCSDCTTCVNCEFCSRCYDCSDCFGCVYIKGKRFYILNKPYSEHEYKQEVSLMKKVLRSFQP